MLRASPANRSASHFTKMTTQLAAAGAPRTAAIACDYQDYVNPRRDSLLSLLGMNAKYDRCLGVELFTLDGRCILDFLSGYCVHNAGHNHPYIIRALKDQMDKCGPAWRAAPQESDAVAPLGFEFSC